MKKLFIIPVLLICMTGASSNNIQPPVPQLWPDILPVSTKVERSTPISVKVDSINIVAIELNHLIRTR